jgi:hypothetical protein
MRLKLCRESAGPGYLELNRGWGAKRGAGSYYVKKTWSATLPNKEANKQCCVAPIWSEARAGPNEWEQCPGRFLGIISRDPSVSKTNRLRVDIFLGLRYWIGVYFVNFPTRIGSFLEVLKLNQSFFKPNRFIYNQRSVLSRPLNGSKGGLPS